MWLMTTILDGTLIGHSTHTKDYFISVNKFQQIPFPPPHFIHAEDLLATPVTYSPHPAN